MNSGRKPNAMLIELVIVILFFSISAGIILQLFVAASGNSQRDRVDNTSLLMAEDLAERFVATSQAPDAFLEADGWAAEGDGYAKAADIAGRAVRMTATVASTEEAGGTLQSVSMVFFDGDREILALPVTRYLPKEDAS